MAITLSNPSPGVAKLSVDGVDRLTIQNGTDTTTIVGNLAFDGNLSAVDFGTTGNTSIGDSVGDVLSITGTTNTTGDLNVLGISTFDGNVEYTGTLTGGTGIVNIGSGQIYKAVNGNVGFGTINPSAVLHLQSGVGGTRQVIDIFDTNTGSTTQEIRIGRLTNRCAFIRTSTAGTVSGTPTDLIFGTNAANADPIERLRINSTGKVGIGTSTPATLLDLAETENPTIRLRATTELGAGSWTTKTLGGLEWFTNDVSGDGPHVGASIRAQNVNPLSDARTTPSYDLVFSTSPTNTVEIERFRIDSLGNAGLGVTPSAWTFTNAKAFQVGSYGVITSHAQGGGRNTDIGHNIFGGPYNYLTTDGASYLNQNQGNFKFFTAPSGTAGNPITFTQAMALTQGGNLLVGTTADNGGRLKVKADTNYLASFSFVGLDGAVALKLIEGPLNANLRGGADYYDFRIRPNYAAGVGSGGDQTVIRLNAPDAQGSHPIFYSNGSESARLTAGGNLLVGIPTDVESSKVVIEGTSQNLLFLRNQVESQNIDIRIGRASNRTAFIRAITSTSAAGSPTILAFGTNVGAADGVERARITSGGNLLVGTTDETVTGIGAKIFSTGNVYFKGNNAADSAFDLSTEAGTGYRGLANFTSDSATAADANIVSRFTSTANETTKFLYLGVSGTTVKYRVLQTGDVQNTNNAYGAISDAKLKENVVDTSPKLEDVKQLRVVNYNLISNPELKQIGLIAQEVEQIFPGLVDSNPDIDSEGNDLGTVTKSVKYSVLVPILLKAMQEQQEIIEDLKARLDAAGL